MITPEASTPSTDPAYMGPQEQAVNYTLRALALIREIVDMGSEEAKALACAVDVTIDLVFRQHMELHMLKVTKDVYPVAARRLSKRRQTEEREAERAANCCWDKGDQGRLAEIIGRTRRQAPPRNLVFYMAVYLHEGRAYYDVLRDRPDLAF